jgi:hypothetical protein
MSTASLTYQEIAARFGVTTASARNLVRRKGWPKALGNDGLARIVVPSDAIPDALPVRGDPTTVQPSPRLEGSTVQPSEDEAHVVAIQALERHIERLEADVAALRSERDSERTLAASHQSSIAALQAAADELRAERDRWHDAAKAAWARAATGPSVPATDARPARRSWWPFHRAG